MRKGEMERRKEERKRINRRERRKRERKIKYIQWRSAFHPTCLNLSAI